MLAMFEQAKSEAAPYVGTGLGVVAVVYGVERIAAAVLRLRADVAKHLAELASHRKAESLHWAEHRKFLELAMRQRKEGKAAERRFMTGPVERRQDALERRLAELECRVCGGSRAKSQTS